jgi:hypothetical protein
MNVTTPVGTASTLPSAATAQRRGLIGRISAPWWFASFITLILVVGEYSAGILGGYERLPLALGTAILVEVVFSKTFRKRWPHPLSAYITGNSVAILTKPAGGLLWPLMAASSSSILSKYCLTFRGQHLWNPSNFGLCMLLLIAPGSFAILSHEWGNEIVTFAVVFAVGLFVAARAKLLHISGTYAAAFLAFAWLRSVLPGGEHFLIEAAPITGAMYLLFTFFMITDPRTIVRGRRNQAGVALLIAAVECAIRILGDLGVGWIQPILPAPPLFALFFVGPVVLVIQELLSPGKGRAKAPA